MFNFLCFYELYEKVTVPSPEGLALYRNVPRGGCGPGGFGWLAAEWAQTGVSYSALHRPHPGRQARAKWHRLAGGDFLKVLYAGGIVVGELEVKRTWSGGSLYAPLWYCLCGTAGFGAGMLDVGWVADSRRHLQLVCIRDPGLAEVAGQQAFLDPVTISAISLWWWWWEGGHT